MVMELLLEYENAHWNMGDIEISPQIHQNQHSEDASQRQLKELDAGTNNYPKGLRQQERSLCSNNNYKTVSIELPLLFHSLVFAKEILDESTWVKGANLLPKFNNTGN